MALKPVLKEFGFTEGFPEQHLAKLAALGRDTRFESNQLILLTGQRSRHFYLVTSGSVCIEARTPVYTVCVQALGPGDAFGWSSLLTHHDTLFQVRAREATKAICWDGEELAAACMEDADFGRELYKRLLELVAGRVKATEARLAEFCGIDRSQLIRECPPPAK